MSSLRALGVGYAFGGAAPVLSDADFHLTPGWTGLVGPNGAGKSTLLRLLSGELAPTEGTLVREPADARVRLCTQRLEQPGAHVLALADSDDGHARRLVGQLGLDPWALSRWPTLSPGERQRWQVAGALAEEPDVLLLDEPTNHLDAEARAWLVRALGRFRGVGVVVSHDRALLDALTHATLRCDAGQVRSYAGPYAQARATWEAERAERVREREAARAHLARQERRLAQAREAQAGAERARSVGARMRNRYDSDARTLGADFRVQQAEKRHGKTVGVVRREVGRAKEALEGARVDKELGRSLFVEYARAPVPQLFTLSVDALAAGDTPLLGCTALVVEREARIRVEGPNGTGKSTLLAALLAHARVPREHVLHLGQDVSAGEGREALARVRELPADVRGRVLSLVAALGVDPERLLRSAEPSPGEARKLLLALGLGAHAWALVLDEPTNHLDLPAIERLEAALEDYPGALVLVTHDDAFASRLTNVRWRLEDREVHVA